MDSLKPKPPETAHLLNDLKSIRELLDDDLQPPLLTEALAPEDIPLLSEVIEPEEKATPVQAGLPPHLDERLRNEAQLILQEVVDDFVPQIEAELKRRLEARLDHLLVPRKP